MSLRWNAFSIITILLLTGPTTMAQGQSTRPLPAPKGGPHGGEIHLVVDYQFEAVFTSNTVRVFVFDAQGTPIATRDVRGRVSMRINGNPRSYSYDFHPESTKGSSLNSLFLAVDLSRIPDRTMSVDIALYGLPPASRRPISFDTIFVRSLSPEQIAINRQRICPVSGKPLGSMGKIQMVTLGKQKVYICCAGCKNALKAMPERYLAKLTQPVTEKAAKKKTAATITR